MTLREKLNRLPPTLCRFQARDKTGRKPLSHADIAKASGLDRSTVSKLSKMTNWDNVTLDTIDRFTTACNVNLLHISRVLDFLKRRKKAFAQRSKLHKELLLRTIECKNGPTSAR